MVKFFAGEIAVAIILAGAAMIIGGRGDPMPEPLDLDAGVDGGGGSDSTPNPSPATGQGGEENPRTELKDTMESLQADLSRLQARLEAQGIRVNVK